MAARFRDMGDAIEKLGATPLSRTEPAFPAVLALAWPCIVSVDNDVVLRDGAVLA